MAIDLNDPEVKAAISAAVEEAVSGLKTKNTELIRKLDAAKPDAEKLAKYDAVIQERDTLASKVEELNGKVKDFSTKLRTTTDQLATEQNVNRSLLIDGGLTNALTTANVQPELMDAVKALLSLDAKVVVDGATRKAMLGDKPLADAVKAWAESDKGKAFVKAPVNSGGGNEGNRSGAGGGKPALTAKPEPKNYPNDEPAFYRALVQWEEQQGAA